MSNQIENDEQFKIIDDSVFKPEELRITSMTKINPGGMSTGKIDNGIRVEHIKTGCAVECNLYRSQYENKREAIDKLELLVFSGG